MAGRPADRHRTRHLGQASPEPSAAVPTFAEYAARVIAHRASNGLRPNTERKYRGLLAGHLMPAFGPTRIDQVTVAQVNEWFASYGRRTHATRADAYRLLSSVMKAAIDEGLRESNPCRVRGGGTDPERAHDIEAATPGRLTRSPTRCARSGGWSCCSPGTASYGSGSWPSCAARNRGGRPRARGPQGAPRDDAGGRRDDHRAAQVEGRRAGRGDPAAPAAGSWPRTWPRTPGRAGTRCCSPRHAGASFTTRCCGGSGAARETVGLPGFHFHDLRHTGATWLARDGATSKSGCTGSGTVIRGWRRGTSTPTPSGTRRTPSGSPAARRSSCRWPRVGRGRAARHEVRRRDHTSRLTGSAW